MGLIIPTKHLSNSLPEQVTDEFGLLTNSVTEASAFCNTWAKNYLPFDAYTYDSDDDQYTINAPGEISYICTKVAQHIYWQRTGQVYRDGEDEIDHEQRLEYYRQQLMGINIEPTDHDLTISLDSEGYQLIARNQNILTHNAYITSGSSNVWNLGTHFTIVRGSVIDTDDYQIDGWYLDGSNEASTLEGTLTYYRSYRNDTIDYMKTTTTFFGRR